MTYNKHSDSSSNINKSQSMNDGIKTEANLFNFPDDRDIDHTELGIPNTPSNDDDFGEFKSPAKIPEVPKKQQMDLFSDITPIAPPPGDLKLSSLSPKSKAASEPIKQTITNDLINFMDDLNVTQPNLTPQTSVNVFSATRMDPDIFSAPQKIETSDKNEGNLLDLDFNATHQNNNTQDDFSDFVAFGNTTTSNETQQLDFFTSIPTVPSIKPEVVTKPSTILNDELEFGEFISEKTPPVKDNKKVGSTWNGLEDKFGLDFANFNLRKGESEKKKVSMNEMKIKANTTNLF